jgi:hypothetical protein
MNRPTSHIRYRDRPIPWHEIPAPAPPAHRAIGPRTPPAPPGGRVPRAAPARTHPWRRSFTEHAPPLWQAMKT